ncbi:MAG: phospholipase [Saprospiraceae bacterium]|nr:phospholipase [Saprospiraceae bacterium]
MKKKIAQYSTKSKLQLVRGGGEYFDLLLDLISRAKHHIHLQTYIFDDDETGTRVVEALKKAVSRNVEVYLLADGYASQIMTKKFVHDMRISGIKFRYFEPLLRSKYFYFGRRMHHKIFVVDAMWALIGGINVSDRYNDVGDTAAWLDMAIVIEGEIAQQLCVLCWKTWKSFPLNMSITPCEEMAMNFDHLLDRTCRVRIRRNDWVRRKNEISRTYLQMIRSANSHITILCSYFLPGTVIRKALRDAANRGVKITVVTAGPSDVKLSKWAERWMYDWMIRNRITLYEYQPTVLHAKVAVCDSQQITIGSYNVNDISAYASIELNLDIKNEKLASELENRISLIIEKDCKLISKEELVKNRNVFRQFYDGFHIG